MMEGLIFHSDCDAYRYGFNGMEKDDEVKGSGNSYDFGARMYDSRLGRWLSIDTQFGRGAQYSPYHYSFNSPIMFSDPNGEWAKVKTTRYYTNNKGELQKKTWKDVFKKTTKVLKVIQLHNAKAFNYDQENSDVDRLAKSVETGLRRTFNSSDYIQSNEIVGEDALGDPVYGVKKEYEVKIEFYQDGVKMEKGKGVKPVESLAEVKMTGDKPDHLFAFISGKTREKMGKPSGEPAWTKFSQSLIMLSIKDSKVVGHEFSHQLGLEHGTMGTSSGGMPANVKDIKNIIQPSNGSFQNAPEIKEMKKKSKQKK